MEGRAEQNGAEILRQRILKGLWWTGTDPWAATEIALALGVAPLSARQACAKLIEEGKLELVTSYPYTVRRVG